jgi:hypothetical protein
MRPTKTMEAKMMRPLGKRVHYRYPAGEGDRRGFLKDRQIEQGAPGQNGIKNWDVIDLIAWDDGGEPWVRVGYYRERPNVTLGWAGQTTITEPVSVWRERLLPAIQDVVRAAENGMKRKKR